jgi:hypothetical protein
VPAANRLFDMGKSAVIAGAAEGRIQTVASFYNTLQGSADVSPWEWRRAMTDAAFAAGYAQ